MSHMRLALLNSTCGSTNLENEIVVQVRDELRCYTTLRVVFDNNNVTNVTVGTDKPLHYSQLSVIEKVFRTLDYFYNRLNTSNRENTLIHQIFYNAEGELIDLELMH